jgi:hypothetical protein
MTAQNALDPLAGLKSPKDVVLEEVDTYLQALEKNGILPNFWCSEEYIEKAGGMPFKRDGFTGIVLDEMLLAPPIHSSGALTVPVEGHGFSIWADFSGFGPFNSTIGLPINHYPKFLDYEFIYDGLDFYHMKGKAWKTFRKNVFKWPKKSPGSHNYKALTQKDSDQVQDVIIDWLSGVEEEVCDDSVLEKYIFQGENRNGLFDAYGDLVAINIWDENYQYINYRYCFCKRVPFLSEYARYLFYTDPFLLKKDKLVNDGGCLDREGLYFFKKRLNPVRIRKVYSWIEE